MEYNHTEQELKYLQGLSLKEKIDITKLRITEFYQHYKGNIYISFSGGKDSTVLLYIAREVYPDIKGVFVDTGLEYPEVKQHVKSFDNIDIIRPSMTFRQVLDEYGFVYPSKEVARKIYYAKKGRQWAINHMNGLNSDGAPSKFKARFKKWAPLIDAPFKISDKCCDIMKKKPFHDYQKKHGGGYLVGTMTEESSLRKQAWMKTGCNSFDKGQSKPLSFWTEQDILRYILDKNIKIPSVYGDIVEDKHNKLKTTKEQRTGCMFCPIGAHLEHPNRFQRMKEKHPKIYEYCMKELHMKEFLDYINVEY